VAGLRIPGLIAQVHDPAEDRNTDLRRQVRCAAGPSLHSILDVTLRSSASASERGPVTDKPVMRSEAHDRLRLSDPDKSAADM